MKCLLKAFVLLLNEFFYNYIIDAFGSKSISVLLYDNQGEP